MKKIPKKVYIVIFTILVVIASFSASSIAGNLVDMWHSVGKSQAKIISTNTDEFIATVNGVGISKKFLDTTKATQIMSKTSKSDAEIVDGLIQSEILYQDAKQNGYEPSDTEVKRFIEDQKMSIRINPDLFNQMKTYWEALGVSEDEYFQMTKPIIERMIVKRDYKLYMQDIYNGKHKSDDKDAQKKGFDREYQKYIESLLNDGKIEKNTKQLKKH